MTATLQTARLQLRLWRDADLQPFAALNADPQVMAHFVSPLDRAASDAMVVRMCKHFQRHGLGMWAVERREDGSFVGAVGLLVVSFEAHFAPCVEVGWRLSRAHWGQGYATEAARAALRHGFGACGLEEIVAFTVAGNARSRAVMDRLGMTRDPADDFDHPGVPEGHNLRRHVLYRMRRGRHSSLTHI
jgi:RimJ/RimL family protein N-acetyltransferase